MYSPPRFLLSGAAAAEQHEKSNRIRRWLETESRGHGNQKHRLISVLSRDSRFFDPFLRISFCSSLFLLQRLLLQMISFLISRMPSITHIPTQCLLVLALISVTNTLKCHLINQGSLTDPNAATTSTSLQDCPIGANSCVKTVDYALMRFSKQCQIGNCTVSHPR